MNRTPKKGDPWTEPDGTRQLPITATEVPMVLAAIESGEPLLLVRACDNMPRHAPQPPVEFVQASAPCETCGGMRSWFSEGPPQPCLDCRIELVGPCPTCEGAGWDWKACADSGCDYDDPVVSWTCGECFVQTATENGIALGHCTGAVTIGHGYAIGGPLLIVAFGDWLRHAPVSPMAVVVGGQVYLRGMGFPVPNITAALAHYGPPESLVGKWALRVQVVA